MQTARSPKDALCIHSSIQAKGSCSDKVSQHLVGGGSPLTGWRRPDRPNSPSSEVAANLSCSKAALRASDVVPSAAASSAAAQRTTPPHPQHSQGHLEGGPCVPVDGVDIRVVAGLRRAAALWATGVVGCDWDRAPSLLPLIALSLALLRLLGAGGVPGNQAKMQRWVSVPSGLVISLCTST